LLRTIYDVRSKIVHEGNRLTDSGCKNLMKKLNSTPKDFVEASEAVVRDVLLAYVERISKGESAESIRNTLDAQIVDSIPSEFSYQ
jgi:hypothetical protein